MLNVFSICFVCGMSVDLSSQDVLPLRTQANNLQWILSLVPLIKALQMALSFLFW
jgi:hypothetical protein